MKKWTELLTIPIALLLFYLYGWIGVMNGWHVFGFEIFEKLFFALVLFLVVIGVVRVIFYITFPTLYKYIVQDFTEGNECNHFSASQRTWAGLLLLCVYLIVFALLMRSL
jgi:hypothetical protein